MSAVRSNPARLGACAGAAWFAAPAGTSQRHAQHRVGVGGLGEVTFALLVVLAAIFAVAWLVRRMRGFGNRVGDAIDVLADVPLGQKERAVLLKVGSHADPARRRPGQVNTLHVLAEPLELAKPAAGDSDDSPAQRFTQLLMRSLGK